MRIVVVHTDPAPRDRWVAALRRELPAAEVLRWPLPGADAPREVVPAFADYAVGWSPPPDFFGRHPTLKAFFSAAAGVDHVLANPSRPPALPVIRLEDAGMAQQMIDVCLHAVLHAFLQRDAYAAQQARGEWRELPPLPRHRFTVGVYGLGVLGRAVAQAIHAAGFPVVGYARSTKRLPGIRTFDRADGLSAFLGECRVLILLAPLTAETENVIDAAALARLPAGAHLVNLARGRLVVDDDLLAALDAGHLAGATLDVFRDEPLPPRHRFWRHPQVRVTPHVAAATLVDPSAAQVAAKIRALEAGEVVGGVVDLRRGY